MSTPWRSNPELAGRFHPDYPDDLQVMIHDGEPRRTQRVPEGCWVRVEHIHSTLHFANSGRDATPPLRSTDVRWLDRTVFRGRLLNQPHHLTGTRQGDEVLFLCSPGMPHPVQVSAAYLEERQLWAFSPCSICGADQSLDPPSTMARTRFPSVPEGSTPLAFTAFCPCGGTMVLALIESTTAH